VIFFVPGYDSATESNLAVAERILPEVCHSLLGHRATREALMSALSREAVPLFAMAHGRPYRLLAHGGESALTGDDTSALARRAVFAYACHTATGLGELAARNGTNWWGYTGSVTAPDSAPVFLSLFVEIFTYLRDEFPHASSPEEHGKVLRRLSELCQDAEQSITDLLDRDPDLDVAPAFLCLSHIWQRLRVWSPGGSSPLMHPDAAPPILLP
jgi:hypothetical protein